MFITLQNIRVLKLSQLPTKAGNSLGKRNKKREHKNIDSEMIIKQKPKQNR